MSFGQARANGYSKNRWENAKEHSERMSGAGNSFYGKTHSIKTKKLLSILMKENNPLRDNFESRKKASKTHTGMKRPDQSEFMKKHNPMNNPESRKKISNALAGRKITWETPMTKGELIFKGKKNPAWEGGISSELYGIKFTKELREQIRTRDKHKCQMCGEKQNGMKLDVHHIDYNKKNNKQNNLLTLCRSCHPKTNVNRKEWQKQFTKLRSPKALLQSEKPIGEGVVM